MMRTLKRRFHSMLARTWLRPGTIRTVPLGPYRGLKFIISPPMLSRLGVFYRAYEPEVSAWLAECVRPGMTVYVVGGHIGIHVLYIARLMQGGGHVDVFEGWPDNYATLQRNIDLNRHLTVEINAQPVCITAVPGTVRMAQGSADGKHHIAAAADESVLEVPAVTLDVFWQSTNQCPDVILIDIEGYEPDALTGGEALLAACKPILVLEHHGKEAALNKWLNERGWRVEPLGRRHLVARA